MVANLLSGVEVAEHVIKDVEKRVVKLVDAGVVPGLGTILVGDDAPSAGYVRKKHDTCQGVGFASYNLHLDSDISQDALLSAVRDFNEDDRVHGFIIQYPVPDGLDFNEALKAMDPDKDVDGLHPMNLGRLVLQEPGPRPCTPLGILEMLDYYKIDIAGKNVVVLGRGPTLGRPLALMLANKGVDAAVTVLHSKVDNVSDYTRAADVVISAVGVPSVITAGMVKSGAVVISGGISWEGKKLLPDVDESVASVASWVTPRLGGVGPTTVAMLLRNTVDAAENSV